MVLFHRRMSTVTFVSGNGKVIWELEHTDGGGRTRKFKPHKQADIVCFPSILDAMVSSDPFPKYELDERALRAELWFMDPQVGDIFVNNHGTCFLEVVDRRKDRLWVRKLQRSVESDREIRPSDGTVRSFSSVEGFQREYQRPHAPGYMFIAWSSKRLDGMDRIGVPGSVGEVK